MGNICCDNYYQNDYRYPFPISLPTMTNKLTQPMETFANPLSPITDEHMNSSPIQFEPYPQHLICGRAREETADWAEGAGSVILSPPTQPRPCHMIEFVRERLLQGGEARDLKERWTITGIGGSRDLALRRGELRYDTELGKGWFGQVILGTASCNLFNIISPISADEIIVCATESNKVQQNSRSPYLMETTVIIKMMKEDASNWEKEYFLHEATIYKDLRHPNLIRLLGHCLETQPYLLVYEHNPLGNVKSYLKNNRDYETSQLSNHSQTNVRISKVEIPKIVINWLREIASALEYIHRNGLAHGDVAARNVALSADRSAKLADYGLGVSNYKEEYFRCGDTAVPIRWLDPNSTIRYDGVMLSIKSPNSSADTWSFGILTWELVTLCSKIPYKQLSDLQTINLLMSKTIGLPHLMEGNEPKIVLDPLYGDKEDILLEIINGCLMNNTKSKTSMRKILNNLLLVNINNYKCL